MVWRPYYVDVLATGVLGLEAGKDFPSCMQVLCTSYSSLPPQPGGAVCALAGTRAAHGRCSRCITRWLAAGVLGSRVLHPAACALISAHTIFRSDWLPDTPAADVAQNLSSPRLQDCARLHCFETKIQSDDELHFLLSPC